MRVSISFFSLLDEAVRIIIYSKPLIFMVLPLGVIMFFSFQTSELLTSIVPKDFPAQTALLAMFETHRSALIMSLTTLFMLGVLRTALRGPLFLLIENTLQQKLSPTTPRSLPRRFPLMRAAFISVFFEALYWFTLLILSGLLFSPLFIASKVNPAVTPTLFQMALVVLLVLAIVFFYIKEFGLLYMLLAQLKPRLAIDLGRKLFQKHTLLSLLFGLFLMALSFLFTFCLNLAMITSALIPFPFLQGGMRFMSGIIILGGVTLLTETLRLLFFHALATTPQIKITSTQKILEEKASGEVPSV